MQECKYASILSPNICDLNLTWPKLFQTERIRRLAHLPSLFICISRSDFCLPMLPNMKQIYKTFTMQATYSDAGSVSSHSPGSQNSPLRRKYPTDKMANNEILSHLSKVRMLKVLFVNHFFETNTPGGSNVRCL